MNDLFKRREIRIAPGREWPVTLLWTLRTVLALTIVAEVWMGDLLSAAEAVLALALCVLAADYLDADGGRSALNLEVIFLLMAVGNCTLGVAGNLYRSLPYYDKFLHVVNPLALAIYGLLLLWNNLKSNSRQLSLLALVALTFLAIVGASAIWEILEFASDQLFNSTTQGSPTMTPLDDTMWDLLLSALGALVGAIGAALAIAGRIRTSFAGRDRVHGRHADKRMGLTRGS